MRVRSQEKRLIKRALAVQRFHNQTTKTFFNDEIKNFVHPRSLSSIE